MRLPDGYANLFPYIMVPDAEGLVAYLIGAFDAVEVARTEHDGRLANVQMRIGAVAFMIGQAQEGLGSATGAYYLFVEDADAVHARALSLGGQELFPPADMPYGDRQGGLRDPFGNIWFVSTRLVDGPY